MTKIIKKEFSGETQEGEKITGDLEIGLSENQGTPLINLKVKAKIK